MNGLPLLLIALLLSLTSCAALKNGWRKQKSEGGEASAESQPTLIGRVELVHPDAQFVLVHLNANSLVPPGTELTSMSAAGPSGKLRVTPERKTLFITADIVSGTPQIGDSVVIGERAATSAATATDLLLPGDQGRPTISISPGAMPTLPP